MSELFKIEKRETRLVAICSHVLPGDALHCALQMAKSMCCEIEVAMNGFRFVAYPDGVIRELGE